MKDALGHGSDARGSEGAAHQGEVNAATKGEFSTSHIDQLRAEYSRINTVDPSQPSYAKLTGMLDHMSQPQLKQLSGAGIKFVSSLANNRLIRSRDASPPPMTPSRVVETGRQFGQKIGGRESRAISALLRGRH